MSNSQLGSHKLEEEHTLPSPILIVDNEEEEEENSLQSPPASQHSDGEEDVELKSLIKTVKSRTSSVKGPQWQLKLAKMCRNVEGYLQPGLIKVKATSEELASPVQECSSGKFEQLLNTWLMTIRLTIGKIHFPPGNNDTVATEVCTKLSRLAMAAITTLKAHKRIFKPIVRHLEYVHKKYSKYLLMVGRCQNLSANEKTVSVIKEIVDDTPSYRNKFSFGDCSASVAILEREIILVHDQDRSAPVLVLKEYTHNYSSHIEILKIFIEHTSELLSRSAESLEAVENNLPFDVVFVRRVTDELLMSLFNYKKARRFQENLGITSDLKLAMKSLNDTIHELLDEIDEIRLMNIWVLTAVEAYFKKIKHSWPRVNLDIQSVFQDVYRKSLVVKWNPWWHPHRLFGLANGKFWNEVTEDIGKFEKYFYKWGISDLHLINLRVPIPYQLSPLLFGEADVVELNYSGSETSSGKLQGSYSEVFATIEEPSSPPTNKGRRNLCSQSHFNASICNIDLDPSKHAEPPVLDQTDIFFNKSNNNIIDHKGELLSASESQDFSLVSKTSTKTATIGTRSSGNSFITLSTQ